jgi:hypothetical protein
VAQSVAAGLFTPFFNKKHIAMAESIKANEKKIGVTI